MITESFTAKALFAVRLQDDFSKQPFLLDKTRVFLKENGKQALENQSKYQVFINLSGTAFTARIENKYYFDQEVGVNVASLNPRLPLVNVTMKPNYLYPFPLGSTLVRGVVVDSSSHPVEGASVAVTGGTVSNQTDSEGKFVLYFDPLTEDEITLQDSQRLIKIAGSTTIQLSVDHPDYKSKTIAIGTALEGDTTLVTTPISLDPK